MMTAAGQAAPQAARAETGAGAHGHAEAWIGDGLSSLEARLVDWKEVAGHAWREMEKPREMSRRVGTGTATGTAAA
eukprot:scaffold234116_cov15-Tisochrysis_lutea.AAC.1